MFGITRSTPPKITLSTSIATPLLALAACTLMVVRPAPAQTFTRVVDPTNPVATDAGHASPYYFGASWIDFDSDGDDDLFVGPATIYENLGGGAFERRLDTGLGSLQVTNPVFSMSGSSFADYDNDGDIDAFLSGERSYLYVNDGSNHFAPITTGVVGQGLAHSGWSCAWADFDNDGALDVAITHPAGFIPGSVGTENHLLLSAGPPNYAFAEVTSGPIVTGLDSYTVGTWSDYDNDGDMDYFIGTGPANGTLQPDNLYQNQLTESGLATFVRILTAPIATENQDGQVWNWIDYDNDGDLDAHVTNWRGPVSGVANRLYRQDAGGGFTKINLGSIVNDVAASITSSWGDFDNDGDLDCFVGNDDNQTNRYYRNEGDGTFTRITTLAMVNFFGSQRSSSVADYDDDGDLDLFVNGPTTSRGLFQNDTANGNGWLSVTLVGTVSNRSAIGAKLRIKATVFGVSSWQMREVSAQNAFNGHSSLRQHFGLGDASTVDSLRVEWPLGGVTELTDLARNQFLTITEGSATGLPEGEATSPKRLALRAVPNPFNPMTTLHFDLPAAGPVSVVVYDAAGRRIRVLVEERLYEPGSHRLPWNGRGDDGRAVGSGVYYVRLDAAGQIQLSRTVLVR